MFSETRTTHKEKKQKQTKPNTTMSNHSQTVSIVKVESHVFTLSIIGYLSYVQCGLEQGENMQKILSQNFNSFTGHNEFSLSFILNSLEESPPEQVSCVVTTIVTNRGWESERLENLHKNIMSVLTKLAGIK